MFMASSCHANIWCLLNELQILFDYVGFKFNEIRIWFVHGNCEQLNVYLVHDVF
jgi:hypothetical protein